MRQNRPGLQGEVRALADALRRHWDPIGQGAMADLPVDEYDAYAPAVLSLLERGVNDRTLAEHLARLESETIGLQPRPLEELEVVAATLRRAATSARAG